MVHAPQATHGTLVHAPVVPVLAITEVPGQQQELELEQEQEQEQQQQKQQPQQQQQEKQEEQEIL